MNLLTASFRLLTRIVQRAPLLRGHRMKASMSREANCHDSAPVESFFGTLKTGLMNHRRYRTREEAARETAQYIDLFYNRRPMQRYIFTSCQSGRRRSGVR